MRVYYCTKLIAYSAFYLSLYAIGLVRSRRTKNERESLQAELLYRCLVAMGPMYIKIGQIAATRSDVVPAPWIPILGRLQDEASAMDEGATRRWLKEAYDCPLEEVFSSFDYEPVASASIAQVHRAVLNDGSQVAVKVIKKDVRAKMKQNLGALELILSAAHLISARARELEVKKRFAELSLLLIRQTDLTEELKSQQTVKANFEGHRYVIVPDMYPEVSNSKVLVMDYMEGIPGKECHKVEFDRKSLARRLQDSIYTMLYMHGVCHGDPHPGNIFFTRDGRLILLDFGITVELTEDEKWGLSSFYYACTRKEWEIAAERFTKHFVTDSEKIYESWLAYLTEITAVLKYHFDECDNRWSTISYFKDVNQVLRRFKAKYTSSFTKVELVFLSCEGFASMIDPEIDIWANARVFTDRYSPYMSREVKNEFEDHFQELMPRSLALRNEASRHLVAPTHIHRYFFPSAYPVFIRKAEGGYFYDWDGNRFVDLSGGYGPHILGYKHPAIQKALADGIESGLVNAIGCEPEIELAKRLVNAFLPDGKVILCNSGTEANLIAIRLARAYTRKNRVAKFEGHYHGWSDQGMVSSWFRFSGSIKRPVPISGCQGTDKNTVSQTSVFQYGDYDALSLLADEARELACVICEPMPSSIAKCDVEFLKKLRDLCSRYNILLVFDEVVTGFRVTYGGAQTLADVRPDLTTLGKIIGGGLPCGAVVGSSEIIDIAKSSEDPFLDYEQKAFVGGTMSGNSLTCQAGVAVLDHLKENQDVYTKLNDNCITLAGSFRETAISLGVDLILEARNSIFSLTFGHKSSSFYRKKQSGSNFKANIALAYYMRKHGVYLPELHSFMISAAHSTEDLGFVGDAFRCSLSEMVEDGFFVH